MAIYTQLDFDEIAQLIAPLKLGELKRFEGVAAGIENTTYFLDVANSLDVRNGRDVTQDASEPERRFVLTIAESLSRADLVFVATFMHDLSSHGLPVPRPQLPPQQADSSTAVLSIRDKPALLVPRVAGSHPQTITPELCRQLGQTLAELHRVALQLDYQHSSHRSLDWVATTGHALLEHLPAAEHGLLREELDALAEFQHGTDLPQAIIHGDLFRDNVLVQSGHISAVIDFFSAGTGYLMLDLAIAVNDWCFDPRGRLNRRHYRALIDAYCDRRRPSTQEIASWSYLLRLSALRFWISRLGESLLESTYGPRGRGKNPTPFRDLLVRHRQQPLALRDK